MVQKLGTGTYIQGLPWYDGQQFNVDVIAQDKYITIAGMGEAINRIPYPNIKSIEYGTVPKAGVDDPENKLFVQVWTGAVGRLAIGGLLIHYDSVEFKREIALFIQMPKRMTRRIKQQVAARMDMLAGD